MARHATDGDRGLRPGYGKRIRSTRVHDLVARVLDVIHRRDQVAEEPLRLIRGLLAGPPQPFLEAFSALSLTCCTVVATLLTL